MKLFSKIFLSTLLILTLALSVQEYATVSYSFQRSVEREREDGINQFRLLRYAIQSNIVRKKLNGELTEESFQQMGDEIERLIPDDCAIQLYQRKGSDVLLAYSSKAADLWEWTFADRDDETISVRILPEKPETYRLFVEGTIHQEEYEMILMLCKDVSDIFQDKQELERESRILYGMILAGAAGLIFLMSYVLLRPVRSLKYAAGKIAQGSYGQRVPIRSSDEIGELGISFNRMAEKIQDNVDQIQQEAQKKEQFVADFAHELKTPLTSIIGYADRIYQSDISREETKKAAEYIFSEGMRLESLAFKMMDLAVLDKQKMVKEVVDAASFAEDIRMTFEKVLKEKQIYLQIFLENGWIRVEYDFFKTLLVNLLDNAIKAGSSKIAFTGRQRDGEFYEFRITDNGCGIPQKEIDRITEAFYMVDKARSRKMNGAGLGLAIAQKIASMHDTVLEYQSKEGVGTTVAFRLKMEDAQNAEEDEEYE